MRVPATAANVPCVRAAVSEYLAVNWPAGVHEGADVALAVTEAVANAVRHAYPNGEGEFELRARVQDDELSVAVRDWGVGVAGPSPFRGLGIGLQLIHRLADRVKIEDCGPGTLVHMRFSTGPAQGE